MFQTNLVKNIDTHVLCSTTVFENRAVHEKMWENTVKWGRPQMTIWRMCIECWMPKATNTHLDKSNYKVYAYIVKHNYILGRMLFIICKAQLHVSATNVGHLQVVQWKLINYVVFDDIYIYLIVWLTDWFLYQRFNPLKPSGHYTYHQFNIQQFYVLPTQCIYVFCMDLRTNIHYFPTQH
jgi:hypothetical protein